MPRKYLLNNKSYAAFEIMIEGFGLTPLSGDRRGYMPPLLKTKQNSDTTSGILWPHYGRLHTDFTVAAKSVFQGFNHISTYKAT